MRVGDLDHWAVHRLNARLGDLADHLKYMGDEVESTYQNLETQQVTEFATFIEHLDPSIMAALDDLSYIRKRFEVALLIATDEDPE